MPADFKGKITFNPDVKPGIPNYFIKCPALEICESGSGDLEEMIADLTTHIREKLSEEFRTTPRSVEITKYTMGIDFSVQGPVNRSLAEFGTYNATIRLGDGTEIDMDRLITTSDKVLAYAKRTGKTPEQVIEMAKAELARQKAEGVGS